MLFICSGIYILLLGIDSKKKSLFLWSGLFFGAGLLIKQNTLVFIGLPIVYFCWALLKKSHPSRRSWFDALCFFTFGYFIPLAIFFISCLITDSWEQMFFWTFVMPTEMTPSISITRAVYQFKILTLPIIKSSPLFFWTAAIGLLSPLWDKTLRLAVIFIVLFFIFLPFPWFFIFAHIIFFVFSPPQRF